MKIRAWHRKSKKGCLTCKKRHLKCDETHPECLRCLRSARECLRYEQSDAINGLDSSKELNFIHYKSTPVPPPCSKQSLTTVSTNAVDSEIHLAAFFVNITVPLLTQCFHGDVWSKMDMPHLLESAEFKDIAVACAAHHMSFVRNASTGPAMLTNTTLLKQYCKALRAHQDLVMHGVNGNASPMMATILLIVLESLRKSKNAMKQHLLGGLRLLKTNHYGLDEDLRLQLLHIYIASSLSTLMYSPDPELQTEIESMSLDELCAKSDVDDYDHLRTLSEYVVVQTYCFIVRNTYGAFDSKMHRTSIFDDIMERLDLIQSSIECADKDVRNKQLATDNLIRARVILCRVFLATSSSLEQSKYDEHEESFRQIVALITEILYANRQGSMGVEWPISFSVGVGIIPVLLLTVQQCRNPQIRRDALKLLDLCPRREGLWDASDSRRIGQAVILFEETDVSADGKGVIPEENRIHYALHDRVPHQSSGGVLPVLCSPSQQSSSFRLIELPLR